MRRDPGAGAPPERRRGALALWIVPLALWIVPLALWATSATALDLARGRPCHWSRTPNYARCTDSGDSVQLTDGVLAPTEYIWIDPRCVGWQATTGDVVTLTIDLGAAADLDSVVVQSAWFAPSEVVPPSLLCAAGDSPTLVEWCGALDAGALPRPDTTSARRIALRVALRPIRARYVVVAAMLRGPFFFTDEIEVHGAAAETDTPRSGPPDGVAKLRFDTAKIAPVCAAQRRIFVVRDALPFAAEKSGLSAFATAAEERARFAARAASWRAAGQPPLVVRRVNPWTRTSPWSAPQPACTDTLRLWPGAWGALAFEIASADTAPRWLRIGPGRRRRGTPRTTLRSVVPVESRDGGWAGDALPLATDSLQIAPGEVRQIWIDVDATNAAAKLHRIEVTVGAQHLVAPVRVGARRLPRRPLGALDWTYPGKFALLRSNPQAAVRDNTAHGVDIWCLPNDSVPWPDPAAIDATGHLRAGPDFTACDRQLALYPVRSARRIGWYLDFRATLEDPSRGHFRHAWMTPEWKRAVLEWLDLWLAHLQARGIERRRIFMQPFDETMQPRARALYAELHAARPDLRFALTVTRNATPEELEDVGRSLGVAILERGILQRSSTWIQEATSRGVEVWTYDVVEPPKTASPERDYRLLAWEAWARGLGACAFWCYGDTGETSGDAWNDFDAEHHDFAVVYGHEGAPAALGARSRDETFVPSKRWQAFRIGMQETALLESCLARQPQLRRALCAALEAGDVDADAWRQRLFDGR